MRQDLDRAVRAAHAAGVVIRAARRSAGVVVTNVAARDLKLNVDGDAEAAILEQLGCNHPILCEETGWVGERADTYWIVDGLDGTVNFHYGLPFCAVSIALVVEGTPKLGVVFDFIHSELFTAILGDHAALNRMPMAVSTTTESAAALLLTALATDRDFSDSALAEFAVDLKRWKKVRMLGSAALSLAYVAAGRADACRLEAIREWDVAAGIALVQAAGGKVVVTPRRPTVVDVFASNGRIAG